jgi:cyclophilin family peptidyl-prolyl cis-trans isomerase/HEAT repeat protein
MFGAMVAALLLLVLHGPWPLDYRLLAAEDARGDAAPLVQALRGPDARQAIRALGRFERGEHAAALLPFLASPDPELRIEALTALAQMKAKAPLSPLLERERDPRVRAVLYESIGRVSEESEKLLLPGLAEEESVRAGAMKGLEILYRTRDRKPNETAVAAIRKTVRESRSARVRELGLLALNRAGDRDGETLESAFRDPDPLVRRLAVAGLKEWRDDPSPTVRYEALRADGGCRRASESLSDASEQVALLAIDLLGNGCPTDALEPVFEEKRGWRGPAHALVSLARISPESARGKLPRFISHPVWQARVYAARAAKILNDTDSLAVLRQDRHPNVVAEALVTPEEALAALESNDYGLLMAALELMKGRVTPASAPVLLETLSRISGRKEHTSRDPRRLLLERLSELGDNAPREKLDYLLSDFDPAIAEAAGKMLNVEARTKRFAADSLPSESFLAGLKGAKATFRMKESGTFVVELLPEAAPLTAAQFAKLAESGYYRGLTFHRIVPNFVIQGGSPGANEYVGTPGYIRDEVSTLSHERGTLGISTRGRDTGDSQIFVNLVDNFRLDHEYTVFARVVDGMESVEAIQEGDVIEEITIGR